jgi:hypothetical protein
MRLSALREKPIENKRTVLGETEKDIFSLTRRNFDKSKKDSRPIQMKKLVEKTISLYWCGGVSYALYISLLFSIQLCVGGDERYEVNTLHTASPPPPPIHFEGHWKGRALEIDLPAAHSCSKTHVYNINNVPVFIWCMDFMISMGANLLLWSLDGRDGPWKSRLFLGSLGTRFARCDFRAPFFKWPSKWIFPHQNH